MAFFRIKKIKEKDYMYLVENSWKKKGSRQKVKNYLGRAYRIELKNNIDFVDYYKIENLQRYIEDNDKNKIITDLIEWELFKFDIRNNGYQFDPEGVKVLKKKRDVVLMVNDGYFCSLTLGNLVNFKAEGDEQIDGYRLARAFVEAGIKVPQEVFIALFGKLYKQND